MAAKKRIAGKSQTRAPKKRPMKLRAATGGRHAKTAKSGVAHAKAPVKSLGKSKAKLAKVNNAKKATTTVTKPTAVARPFSRAVVRSLPIRPVPSRRHDSGPLTSSVGLIHGIPPYQAKAGEPYMNTRQLQHFRHILLAWKRELMEEVDRTVHHMQDEASNFPDPNDRATQESEFGLELRTRDRERKLLKKIDSALERIEEGTYGYCEETGEEIGLRRLEARPVATLSVEAQERRELAERQFRDREDGF